MSDTNGALYVQPEGYAYLQASPDGALDRYGHAIAQIESGGRYDATGPATRSGDRAYGKYQVMGANVPGWTRDALGKSLTPQEFLASPEAQDATFRHRFGKYVTQYGNVQDAASAWFTGRPLAQGANARDVLGTTGQGYVDRFTAALQGGMAMPSQAPTNVLAGTPRAQLESSVNQLFGLGNVERYQLWPERTFREALNAPHQALTQGFESPEQEFQGAQAISSLAGTGAMPFAERGAAGALGGRLTQVAGPATGEVPFYSSAAQAVQNAGFQRASPSQWAGFLRNAPGVKNEELDWMGTPDWLGAQSGPVTKDALLGHMQEQSPQLSEVTRAAPKYDAMQLESAIHEAMANQHGAENYNTNLPMRIRQELLGGETRYGGNLLRNAGIDEPIVKNIEDMANSMKGSPVPKFASYQLPGGENYREALLTLPLKGEGPFAVKQSAPGVWTSYDPTGKFGSSGGGFSSEAEATADAAARNKEARFRPEAYRSPHWDEPNVLAHVRMNDREVTPEGGGKPLKTLFLEEVQSDWHQQGRRRGYGPSTGPQGWGDTTGGTAGGVPNAPFKSSWPELVLKRILRQAAEEGYEAVGWTPGETQAARYDLSKQVKSITATKEGNGLFTLEGVLHTGRTHHFGNDISASQLADYVGKDLAEKIAGQSYGVRDYSDLDLKVGGEGMLKFYDDMLPNVANKLAKRFGRGKTEVGHIMPIGSIDKLPMEAMTPSGELPVHLLRLSPELKSRALSQGFPLFSKGAPIGVLDAHGQHRTLHPVDYDPFSAEGIQQGESL